MSSRRTQLGPPGEASQAGRRALQAGRAQPTTCLGLACVCVCAASLLVIRGALCPSSKYSHCPGVGSRVGVQPAWPTHARTHSGCWLRCACLGARVYCSCCCVWVRGCVCVMTDPRHLDYYTQASLPSTRPLLPLPSNKNQSKNQNCSRFYRESSVTVIAIATALPVLPYSPLFCQIDTIARPAPLLVVASDSPGK